MEGFYSALVAVVDAFAFAVVFAVVFAPALRVVHYHLWCLGEVKLVVKLVLVDTDYVNSTMVPCRDELHSSSLGHFLLAEMHGP